MTSHSMRLRRDLCGFYRHRNRVKVQGRGPFVFGVVVHRLSDWHDASCEFVGLPHLYSSRVKPTPAVWELRRVWLMLPGDVNLFTYDEEG